jgi:trans-aconitate 2-methyltransferase
MRQTAVDMGLASRYEAVRDVTAQGDVLWYHQQLHAHARSVDLWSTTYLQHLPAPSDSRVHPVVAFTRETGLRPFLAAAGQRAGEFESHYQHLIAQAYPQQTDGSVLFPFTRLFGVVQRA